MVNPKSHSKIRTQHTASDFSFSFPMKRYHKLFLILNINFHSSVFWVVRIHGDFCGEFERWGSRGLSSLSSQNLVERSRRKKIKSEFAI